MKTSITFFDGIERDNLLPLTYLRPVSLCRVGIRTIEEKWLDQFSEPLPYGHLTQDYLSVLFPQNNASAQYLYINGASLPNADLLKAIHNLHLNEVIESNGSVIAFKTNQKINSLSELSQIVAERQSIHLEASIVRYPEDILNHGISELLREYYILSDLGSSEKPPGCTRLRGTDIYIGKNTRINDAIINATDGPIYIDDNAEIMEGAVIKGPVYIGKGSKIHVGAKIYAQTILGPECRVGGEVKRTTIFGYTNKAHDGYLGDSVIGRWCNLGADTNNSNMKNTYGLVSLWDIRKAAFRTTDRQFLGMILGDHTMCAINTSFNTGSVTGIFANIIDRSPDRYTPSFSWGKLQQYKIDKAVKVAKIAMQRRGIEIEKGYISAIKYLCGES